MHASVDHDALLLLLLLQEEPPPVPELLPEEEELVQEEELPAVPAKKFELVVRGVVFVALKLQENHSFCACLQECLVMDVLVELFAPLLRCLDFFFDSGDPVLRQALHQ